MSAVGGGATLRGLAAVKEVTDLLAELRLIDNYAEKAGPVRDENLFIVNVGGGDMHMTGAEVKFILERRRNRVLNLLENKGIHIRPDVGTQPNHNVEPAAYEPGTLIDKYV